MDQPYYADPERYEAEYAPFRADVAWYTARAAVLGGPALELGCGTGRVLCALAGAGLEVDGLDNAPAMLARARERVARLPPPLAARVGLVQADMAAFSLPRRYHLVLAPLNGLMHLLDDASLAACLARVAEHLAPGGRFLFDLSVPRPDLLAEHGGEDGLPLRSLRLRGLTYDVSESQRYDPATRISLVRYRFSPRTEDGQPFTTELHLRLFPPGEIPGLLARAGLKALERHGDFRGSPPGPDDVMQLWEAGLEPRSAGGGPKPGRNENVPSVH
ncbi:MAG TPA: class I SAM-dependent methyltransferase [Myxococcota bacterium]|nr:class I SAM-dependent methyltransferase [Myxococcota bacterium]HRY95380.1 class I SAM-dependent methyltransferase [Myxococcota bacterium]HSA23526.1 class I SAM-dependent methyltransferase [Myxococcota bacterium]